MKAAVVINPQSGRRRPRSALGESRAEVAQRMLHRGGFADALANVEIHVTSRRGHGAELAGSCVARGFDVVVAWGGDGTVNEVAGPLIGSRTALGIVPAGSGDGLARGLGLPRTPAHALRQALLGPTTPIDTGVFGERHFLNIGGTGFDAAVARGFDRRSTRGLITYVRSAFREIWTYQPAHYRVEFDDGAVLDGAYQLVAFANCREYGNRLVLAPAADPRDGQLNVVAVETGSALRQIWRSRRLALGSEKPVEGVHRRTAASAVVHGEHLLCHVDGEPFEAAGKLEVAIKPGALLVRGFNGRVQRASSSVAG